MTPDGEVSEREYYAIVHISELIRKKEVIGTWSEATFTGTLDQRSREELITMDKELNKFLCWSEPCQYIWCGVRFKIYANI